MLQSATKLLRLCRQLVILGKQNNRSLSTLQVARAVAEPCIGGVRVGRLALFPPELDEVDAKRAKRRSGQSVTTYFVADCL